MAGFLYAFLATLLAGIGARDQAVVAALAARLGARPSLLAIGIITGALAAALAAWGASSIAPLFTGKARMLLAAIALGMAGAEMLVLKTPRAPAEPTRSLGAVAIVLFAHQLTDSLRFLVFAIAMATMAPIPAAMGGALGGAAAVTAGWLAGSALTRPELPRIRRIIGALLLAIAGWIALRALDG